MTADPRFELSPTPGFPVKISADRRRTLARQRLLDMGRNPATRLEFRQPLGETCGTCAHHQDGRFHKCLKAGVSMSAATDIRVSWPACTAWAPVLA